MSDSTFHPDSLFCLPLRMSTTKATSVASSNTAAAVIMNPTLRHMEQKWRSVPWQSSYCGKGRQLLSTDEQLSCRPIVLVKRPVGDSTSQPIQFGMKIEASVMAVAVASLSSVAVLYGGGENVPAANATSAVE